MKKHLIYIILFLNTLCAYSLHKDEWFVDKYGNVKTLTHTGFYGYGVTEKVRIAGKLAENLSKRLSYKDTIVIDFRHDYTEKYDKILIVENGNSSTDHLINSNIESIEKYQLESHSKIVGKTAICIRLLDTEFDIIKVLKILEYCILNKFQNEKIEISSKEPYFYPDEKIVKVRCLGLNNNLINQILTSKDSDLLLSILNEKTELVSYNGMSVYYKNRIFYFDNGKTTYKARDLLYLVGDIIDGFFIFPTNNSFVYFNKDNVKTVTHHAGLIGYYPYTTTCLNKFESNVKLLEDKNVFIYKFFNENNRILFSKERNEIIKVFKK